MTEASLSWRTLDALHAEDRAAAAQVLQAAPGYAQLMHGRPPLPQDVDDLLDGAPPGRHAGDKRVLGFTLAGPASDARRSPLVGVADLVRGHPHADQAFLGLMLFSQAHQGRGLLPQALAVVDRLALGWGCRSLQLAVRLDNRRAHRVWQREGFAELARRAPAPGNDGRAADALVVVMARAIGSHAPADPMRVLCGQGFWLEPLTEHHAEAMFPLLGDAELHEYNDDAPPASLQALRERYRRLESRRSTDGLAWWLNWVIRLPDGTLAGYVQATVQDDGRGSSRAHVAYVLGRAYWGRGLATRATQRMLDELALRFHVRQLQATAALANHRSLRVLHRLGFQPGGATDVEGDVWVGRRLEPPWHDDPLPNPHEEAEP